ncbi:MAG TPA: nucleoside phosphorylase [Anaerolineales bacterium]|nr:nucleoside phosphorylase [Anaerolineales bacterium]
MSLPRFPGKFGHPAIFTAGDLAARTPGAGPVPERMLICFQDRVFSYATRKYRGRKLQAPFGEISRLRRAADGRVGVAGRFGIGAPAAVFVLEWLAALGARTFTVVGFAGGLHERQRAGDLVVCTRALRDEGTSYHYLPPAQYAEPDMELTAQFTAALNQLGYAHERGASWTIDAPFRETFAEVEHYRSMDILTVEMEAAALFSASAYLGTACAAAFAIGDGPKDDRWQIDFDRRALNTGLEKLVDAAVATLAAEPV